VTRRVYAAAWVFALASALATQSARAEPIVDLDALGMEGYAGPHFRISAIEGKATLVDGGPLLMLRRGRVGLGVSWSSSEGAVNERWMSYLGARVEYVLVASDSIELSAAELVGGGAMLPQTPAQAKAAASFFVSETELVLAWRCLQSTRIALVAGFRWAPRLGHADALDERTWSAPYVGFALQDGVFGAPPPHRQSKPWLQISGYVSEKLTWFDGQARSLDGGGTRLLIGPDWAVGVTGYLTRKSFRAAQQNVSMGYGGVEGVWTPLSRFVVHPAVGILMGFGGAGYTDAVSGASAAATFVFVEPSVQGSSRSRPPRAWPWVRAGDRPSLFTRTLPSVRG
jgi:hypothetical protein